MQFKSLEFESGGVGVGGGRVGLYFDGEMGMPGMSAQNLTLPFLGDVQEMHCDLKCWSIYIGWVF